MVIYAPRIAVLVLLRVSENAGDKSLTYYNCAMAAVILKTLDLLRKEPMPLMYQSHLVFLPPK